MMSNTPSNLTTVDQEQLVAYLDGELSADQCAAVEDRLSADGTYRHEMQRLARAWDALDELPRATAGDGFAKTTIEMVTVAAEEEIAAETTASSHRRISRHALLVGWIIVAVVLGFVGARAIWPDPNRQLVADLPVIQNLDALSQFHDVAFLRSLNQGVDGEYHVLSADALKTSREALITVSSATSGERQQRIRELDPGSARSLSVNFARFLEIDGAEQRRLRQLHREIIDSTDADMLIDTMNQYSAWLADRSAGNRAALRELSANDRIVEIARQLKKDRFRAVLQLSNSDRDALREAIVKSARAMREEILREASSQMKKRLENLNDLEFAWRWMRFGGSRFMRQRRGENVMLGIYEQARKSLSEEAQQNLDRQPSIPARGELMRRWIAQAFRKPEVTDKELEEFFASESLTNDERERLLALPQKQMRDQLMQRFDQEKYGFQWDPDGDPSARGGRPGDGPRGRGGPGGGRGRFDRPEGSPRRPPGSPGDRGRGPQDGPGDP